MIICKSDWFLFRKMGKMLLASSGKNKDRLIYIQELCSLFDAPRVVGFDQNYVFFPPSKKLHQMIDEVFKNIFVGCDRTWMAMNAEVKFSLIMSTIWNKCFNSLWKLKIAVKIENVWEGAVTLPTDLPKDLAVGVREYEDRALKVLARSITKCLESKT